ncbi:hypothetical protein [Pseudomonas sp. NUPR-001]|uniref:hypothetical protein n=1 Tax=Pseudomonas sp. NUPR-001 TaxID=3416058 RepID=UPI003F99B0A6
MGTSITQADMDKAIAALKKEGEDRVIMVAETVCIFAADVPAGIAEDVLQGMRLMSISANKKFNKETQQREWYNFYNEGLAKFGWTLTGAAHVEEAIDKEDFTPATLTAHLVTVSLGHKHRLSGCVNRALQISIQKPKARELMEQSSLGVTGKSSTIQVAACEMSPQGLPIMHMTSVQLSYDKTEKAEGSMGRKIDKSNTKVYRASQQGTFSVRHFDALRKPVLDKLVGQALNFLDMNE